MVRRSDTGGLNSHSLVIMVVAVLNYYNQRNSTSFGKLLILFFGFYSKFDYSNYEIAITGGK